MEVALVVAVDIAIVLKGRVLSDDTARQRAYELIVLVVARIDDICVVDVLPVVRFEEARLVDFEVDTLGRKMFRKVSAVLFPRTVRTPND